MAFQTPNQAEREALRRGLIDTSSDGDLIIGLADRDLGLGADCDPDSVNLCMESNQACDEGVLDGDYGCAPWKRLCSLRGEGANGELCE